MRQSFKKMDEYADLLKTDIENIINLFDNTKINNTKINEYLKRQNYFA